MKSAETDGRFGLVEHPIAPRALAGPMHVHQHEDEYSYVLEGEVGFLISPGGFEDYFAELAPLLQPERDFEGMARLQAKYGLEMDFSSIERLSRQHGLGTP